jgi:hypothetical protein
MPIGILGPVVDYLARISQAADTDSCLFEIFLIESPPFGFLFVPAASTTLSESVNV